MKNLYVQRNDKKMNNNGVNRTFFNYIITI